MGELTLDGLRDSVRFHVQNSKNATDALLNRAINATYRHVARPSLYQHRELRATVAIPLTASTPTYSLSPTTVNGATYKKSANASYTNPRFYAWVSALFWDTTTHPFAATTRRTKLIPISQDEMDRSELKPTGEPREYVIWGETLELRDIPGTTEAGKYVELRGYVVPEALAADGDVTVLAPDWDDVIVVGSAWRMFRALGEYDRAMESRVEFGQQIADIVDYEMVEGENDDIRFTMRFEETM